MLNAIAAARAGAIGLVMVVTGCTSTADRPDEANMQAETAVYNAAQTKEGDRVVCEMEAVTGTRMKQKVCRKVSEMERDEDNAERMIKEVKPLPPAGR
jgi:hypothetical protein